MLGVGDNQPNDDAKKKLEMRKALAEKLKK